MLEKIKTQFYSLLKDLGYKASDNGTYNDDFPWLMVRTGSYQSYESYDVKYDMITLILDVFSTYNGEKEIIEISENILKHLQELRKNNPDITSVSQSGMLIIGDKETGPVRKHGIIKYSFVATSSTEEVYNEDNPTGN